MVALVSQLAFHPMFKISTIHQHTSFNPNRRSRRSLGLRSPRYATPCVRLDVHFLSSFVVRLSNPNVFRLLPGNSLITLSGPYRIIRYKNFNKCFNFFSKRNLRGFLWHCYRLQKSPSNNYEHYQKLIQWVSKRCDNKQVSFKNAAAASNTSGFWRVYLSVRLPQRTGHASFLTSIFHKVV